MARFTLLSMMIIVPLAGILLAAVIDDGWPGNGRIDLGHIPYTANDPLIGPTKIRAITGADITEDGSVRVIVNTRFNLENGRALLIDDRPLRGDESRPGGPEPERMVPRIRAELDGSATICATSR